MKYVPKIPKHFIKEPSVILSCYKYEVSVHSRSDDVRISNILLFRIVFKFEVIALNALYSVANLTSNIQNSVDVRTSTFSIKPFFRVCCHDWNIKLVVII